MITWLGIGLVLGFVHAFDADHVMAVSVYATGRRSVSEGVRDGLRWALGHGCMLLLAGGALLLMGRALPPAFSLWAEGAVGWLMIGLGLWVLVGLIRARGHLHFHRHGALPVHAHWHVHSGPRPHDASAHRHQHGALMVGALHGLAGSAPLLAVLPLASRSPLLGLAYLLVFAIGVALAMAVLSGLMAHLADRLAHTRSARALPWSVLRALCATGSIGLGGWLLAIA